MSDDKVKFASGATSSKGHDAPYQLMTHCAVKRGALRFGAGNVKHENSDTILANANWLKAFHARDLAFFRNRYQHARDHMDNEMQGIRDLDLGGNFGAVVWFLEVMCYVEDNDPAFYDAIIGLKPHPGERGACHCPRCKASFLAPREMQRLETLNAICSRCEKQFNPDKACATCCRCPEHCKCL